MLAPAMLRALLQGATPVSPIVKIDSREQGRTFYVDTDEPEIRKALTPRSASLSTAQRRGGRAIGFAAARG